MTHGHKNARSLRNQQKENDQYCKLHQAEIRAVTELG
jgi:hypothetical protein